MAPGPLGPGAMGPGAVGPGAVAPGGPACDVGIEAADLASRSLECVPFYPTTSPKCHDFIPPKVRVG